MHREGGVCSPLSHAAGVTAPPEGATTTTAASGGNRESLLGQRPARRKRSAADAGCRNPALSAKQTERLYKGQSANYTKASPGFFPRTLAFYYTTKHHSGVVMSRFQHPRPAGRHDFSAYLAEKEAKTHSVRSWPLSCFLYRPNKSACVPVRYKYNSVSVW